jgi:hypothetical protein
VGTEPTLVGQHALRQEDDLAVCRLVGPFREADAAPFHAFLDRVYESSGRCLVLADVSAMTKIDAEARRYAAEWNAKRRMTAIAVVGANAAIRVIASMMVTAIGLVHQRSTAPVEFVKEEAEARRWLAAQRERVIARGGA